jgi:tetratricopeptide (TPR) repeat protein
MRSFDETPPNENDPRDRAHWDAVEEISELLHEQRFREAMEELRTVLQADGTNPYAFYFLGIALYENGQLEAARDAYRACLKFAPAHLGARVALTHVLRALGDLRGAIHEGSAALAQAPGDADVLYALGMAHFGRGDVAAARRFLEAFLQAGPEYESSEEVKALLAEMGGQAS